MIRAVLSYAGQKILLPRGETIIGRALHCGIRFNDPAVSREHARVCVRDDDRLTIENLSQSNGTVLNGAPLEGVRDLKGGDELRLGHRRLVVELVEDIRHRKRRSITLDGEVEAAPGSGLLLDEEAAADESTQPGQLAEPYDSRAARVGDGGADGDGDELDLEPGAWLAAAPAGPITKLSRMNCPSCRAQIDPTGGRCSACGYVFPPGRSNAVTMRLAPQGDDRTAPRFAVELPLVYSSESLTFEAIVRDISRGGMFIASELLDPVGTPCDLTALPDGHPAMTFSGVVVHVAARAADGGRPAGLGVRFTFVSLEARRWLEILLARYPTDERDPYLS